MTGFSGQFYRSHPCPVKTVVIFRNGDAFFPGRRLVVNPRQLSTFDSFLNTVTFLVEAPFGAVRNVYTPREGHRVLSLESLQHGEKYVVAGAERFKRLDYSQITLRKPNQKKSEEIKPVVHSRIIAPARWKKFGHESCAINVFTNGDILVPPVRILIPKFTLRSWEKVLAMVTEKVQLRTGAVRRLCRLDGTPIHSSTELEHNQYYVATGLERFRLLPYFHWVPRMGQSEDVGLGVYGNFFPQLKKKNKHVGDAGTVLTTTAGEKEMTPAEEIPQDRRVKVDSPIDQVEARAEEEEQAPSGLPPLKSDSITSGIKGGCLGLNMLMCTCSDRQKGSTDSRHLVPLSTQPVVQQPNGGRPGPVAAEPTKTRTEPKPKVREREQTVPRTADFQQFFHTPPH
ncbi:doublecortin domain-containing protein 2C-like [Chanos chanos]|uniref:Doublecortin domain-containing protein 2C-like n=1 Tax=Chanos chanos TaxID=29144 RepID=A0A6J2V4K0_CHACN|nr:doublecortin domain-containing protein 2C [Chanos chanos]